MPFHFFVGGHTGQKISSTTVTKSSHQFTKSLSFADLAAVIPDDGSKYNNCNSSPTELPSVLPQIQQMTSYPISSNIQQIGGNMSFSQALQHFMVSI